MEKIYYISQGDTPEAHLFHIEKVCATGIRLVQLRIKNIEEELYLRTAIQAVEIVHRYNGMLIVNDNISVARLANADGVHLGQKDSLPLLAREQLPDKIIGGTANTAVQCRQLIEQGVDYLGVGPFQFTTTKQNISPLLGVEGYREIVHALSDILKIPIYAIGGITETDIEPLLSTGIHGVAISGALTAMSSEELTRFIKSQNTK